MLERVFGGQGHQEQKDTVIQIKRVYEEAAPADGRRFLVERLWPRGIKKEALAAEAWLKEVAPSAELRKWFDHRVERWEEFQRRYRSELDANPGAWEALLEAGRRGTVTLLYSARDTLHNGARVLCDYLAERGAAPAARRRSAARAAAPKKRRASAPRRGAHP